MEHNKIKVSLVRGAFLNPFELQNYYPLMERSLGFARDDKGGDGKYDIQAISSLRPISDDIKIQLIKLPSPTDLPDFPFKYPLLNRLFTDAHYLRSLEQVIAGSDIVHVAETYYHYTIQAIKAKQNGLIKKIVSTVWEVIPFNNESIRGRKEFKRLSYQHIDHFLAVTELARKALLEEGVPERKISVIPMGVDLERFKPAKREETKAITILSVARLVPEKGIGELVTAFHGLYQNNKNLRLTLVGRGPLKSDFMNLRGVKVKTVPYSQIEKEYQNADIFVLPSKITRYWQEQYGMALIEAMACGLPVITTRTGAIGEVCADAAIYVKTADANDLQLKLAHLIASRAERQAYGKKGLAMAKSKYDYQRTAKQIDALYQKVLWG